MIEKKLIEAIEPVVDAVVALEKKVEDLKRLPGPVGPSGKDGMDADPVKVADAIVAKHAEALKGVDGKDGRDGVDGKDGAPADPEAVAGVMLDKYADHLRGQKGDPGQNGVDGKDGRDGVGIKSIAQDAPDRLALILDTDEEVHIELPRGEKGDPGKDGTTTVEIVANHDVAVWQAGIYRKDVVVQHFLGRLYAAKCDTAEEPGDSDDWMRLGTSGLRFTGGFKKDHEYEIGDIYIKDYSAFMWDGQKTHLIAARQKETPALEVAKSIVTKTGFAAEVIKNLMPEVGPVIVMKAKEAADKAVDDSFLVVKGDDDQFDFVHIKSGMVLSTRLDKALVSTVEAVNAEDNQPPLIKYVGKHETGRTYSRGDVINFGNQLYVCALSGKVDTAADIAEKLVLMLNSSVVGGSGGGGGGTLWPANPFPVGIASNDAQTGNIWLDGRGLIRYVADANARTALLATNPPDGTLIFQMDTRQVFAVRPNPTPGLSPIAFERLPGDPANPNILSSMVWDPATNPLIQWEDDRTRLEVVSNTADLNIRTVLPTSHLVPGKVVFVRATSTLWEFVGNPAAMTNTFQDWKPLVTAIPSVARMGMLPPPTDPHIYDGVVYHVQRDFSGNPLDRLFIWDSSRGSPQPALPPLTIQANPQTATPSLGDIATLPALQALPQTDPTNIGQWATVSVDLVVPVGSNTPFDGTTIPAGSTLMSLGDRRRGTRGWAIVPGTQQPSTVTINPAIQFPDLTGFMTYQMFMQNAQPGDWIAVNAGTGSFTVSDPGSPLDGVTLQNGTVIMMNDLNNPTHGLQVNPPIMVGGTSTFPNAANAATFGAEITYSGAGNHAYWNTPTAGLPNGGSYMLVTGPDTLPVNAGNIAGQTVAVGDFIVLESPGNFIIVPSGSQENSDIRANFPNPVVIGGTPTPAQQPPASWTIPGPNVVVPAPVPPADVSTPPFPAVGAGRWVPIETKNWLKDLRATPDQLTDREDGDLQLTIESQHKEIKVFHAASGSWVKLFSEDDVKGWIAALSLFEGTVQEVGGSAIGALELTSLPDLNAMSGAADLTMTSHYWTWMGTPGYVVQPTDPMIGQDIAGVVLNPGDWVQVANRGGDGSGIGANGGPPDLVWVTIGGDLLAKSRADRLFGLQPYTPGGWEQGSLVVFNGDIYRAAAGVTATDPAPALPPTPVSLTINIAAPIPNAAGADLTSTVGAPVVLDTSHPAGFSVGALTAFPVPPGYNAATGAFVGEDVPANSILIYTGNPTLSGTTAQGYPVDLGWVMMPPGAIPAGQLALLVNPTPPPNPWQLVPISGGLKVATSDTGLPATAPPGEVWIVLSSAQAGGGQALYAFDQGASRWQQLGGGGQPIDFTGRKQVVSLGVPVGTVITYAGKILPAGYLMCDGSTFSQVLYPELYAALGNSDVLPNLKDQFIRGGKFVDNSLPLKSVTPARSLGSTISSVDLEVFFRRRDLQVGDYVSSAATIPPIIPRGSNLPVGLQTSGSLIFVYCGEGYGFEMRSAAGGLGAFQVSRTFPYYRDTTNRPRTHDFKATGNTANAGDHVHSVAAVTSRGGGATTWIAGNTGGQAQNTGTAGNHSHSIDLTITGGDVETMPAYVVLAYLIKADDRAIRARP